MMVLLLLRIVSQIIIQLHYHEYTIQVFDIDHPSSTYRNSTTTRFHLVVCKAALWETDSWILLQLDKTFWHIKGIPCWCADYLSCGLVALINQECSLVNHYQMVYQSNHTSVQCATVPLGPCHKPACNLTDHWL